MCIYIYIYTHVYIYIYIYTYSIYTYMYIYMKREREREKAMFICSHVPYEEFTRLADPWLAQETYNYVQVA